MSDGTGVSTNSTRNNINSNLKILCVGLANVDTVLVCNSFPLEDTDQRCKAQRIQTGGNATNNCTVLSALGMKCEFLGCLSNCHYSEVITEHFKKCGITFDNCIYYDDNEITFPNSTVIINDVNGSRTILHYRKNWPEVRLEDFKKLDLSQYSWIHFEGRNVEEVRKMIDWIDFWKRANSACSLCVSVELEKPQPEMSELFPLGDVVFISKDFAQYKGFNNMFEVLANVSTLIKTNATVIVPWGELGAAARSADGTVVHSPVYSPTKVVDTLGAGDTFCAAVISALNMNCSLQESIKFGCKVAGAKVGMYGYDGLSTYSWELRHN